MLSATATIALLVIGVSFAVSLSYILMHEEPRQSQSGSGRRVEVEDLRFGARTSIDAMESSIQDVRRAVRTLSLIHI